MRSLPMVLIAVLLLSLPAAGQAAPAAKGKAETLADEMTQAATPLGWFHVADRLWEGINTKANVVDRDTARRIMASEFDARYRGVTTPHLWGPLYLVGLIPADCDYRQTYLDLLGEQDAAVYDWGTKRLNVVKDEQVADLVLLARKLLITHEIAGALDHKHVYKNRTRDSLDLAAGAQHDARLAVMAVIEGSGRLLEKRCQAELKRTRKISRSDTLKYAEYEESRGKRFMELPPYFRATPGTHVCGMHFLMRGKPASALIDGGETGREALLALRDRMPKTTEQVLHPEKFFDKQAADPPIVVDPYSVERNLDITGGWVVAIPLKDTFGELLCSLLAKPKDAKPNPIDLLKPSYYITEAGSGWGGDRFFLLTKGLVRVPKAGSPEKPSTENVKGAWVTVWDTPKDREEFVAAYSKNMPQGTGVVLVGTRTAVFLCGMAAEERDRTSERIKKNPPGLKQGIQIVDP